ncbi:hypothetical protein GYMLUDRAFT_262402 [Collybiopsis luxurians FD-317 M1]|uniref:Uncharacterized protein n=1 Tax=Collybiopsis luxurians FD-317 M1 TaxID=944289 RepID=A0A0D0C7X2_9AGAR|nr:hypothetical protein GYMLUDRAFT_262402 [Collybiopsis luxurians FD-317 M1]
MSAFNEADRWPNSRRRLPGSRGGEFTNFEPAESISQRRSTYTHANPTSDVARTQDTEETSHHRSSRRTNISGGTISSVGRNQTIDSDHHNSYTTRHEVGPQNNYGINNNNIHIHIHLPGSGPDSKTLTCVFSFGLFGCGDAMIMRCS